MRRTKRRYMVSYAFANVTVMAFNKREAVRRGRKKVGRGSGIFCYVQLLRSPHADQVIERAP